MTINKTIGREIGMFFPKFLTLLFSQKKKKKNFLLFSFTALMKPVDLTLPIWIMHTCEKEIRRKNTRI